MADITVNQVATQTFYQIPQIFMVNVKKKFSAEGKPTGKIKMTSLYAKKLSNDGKIAYGVLYDRCMLSIHSYRNGELTYVDENGSVFLVYTVEDLMEILDRSKPTVLKIKKELKELGLLREVKQGKNRPNRLYLQNVNAELQEYEHYDAKIVEKGRDKGTVVYHHVKTLDYKGCVLFEIERPGSEEESSILKDENSVLEKPIKSINSGSQKFLPPKKAVKSTNFGSQKSLPPEVKNFNPIKTEKGHTENNSTRHSSRKPASNSKELDQTAGTCDTPSQKTSGKKFIKPQVYSLLQEIADSYRDHLPWYQHYNMTHRQKMIVGQYIQTGWITSSEVLHCIERIPECDSPFAYLIQSIENLIGERKSEAKMQAHREAEYRYLSN